MDALYIILTASLFAISCGLLGCFLILRKMAMVGDAISHAVLPGIVVAFLLTGSRGSFEMILGASPLGVFTTFIIEFFHHEAKVQADAAIGVTFTSLFALGVILISVFAGKVDLDQDCVLYGEIAYVPIDLWITDDGVNRGPVALYVAGFILLVNVLFLVSGFRYLYVTTFDPAFALTAGISVTLWNYLLMGAVSMTTVAAFDSVGAILVVALLVCPPATAYLLTDKFQHMLGITVVIAIAISVLGYYLAVALDGSIAGAIVAVAGLFFGLAFLYTQWRKKRLQVGQLATASLCLAFTLWVAVPAKAQTIVTDRPDQTESALVVGKGVLQIESGVLLEYAEQSERRILSPTTLFRLGLGRKVEIRILNQLETQKTPALTQQGISDIELGTKIQFTDPQRHNVDMALLTHLVLPTGSAFLRAESPGFSAKFCLSHALLGNWGMGYNLGFARFANEPDAFTYTVSLAVPLNHTVGLFVAPYGSVSGSESILVNGNAGLTCLLTDNWQLDFSFGTGITQPMNFVSMGASWRMKK